MATLGHTGTCCGIAVVTEVSVYRDYLVLTRQGSVLRRKRRHLLRGTQVIPGPAGPLDAPPNEQIIIDATAEIEPTLAPATTTAPSRHSNRNRGPQPFDKNNPDSDWTVKHQVDDSRRQTIQDDKRRT